MKITKSELKEMIREALREELTEKVNKKTFSALDAEVLDFPIGNYAIMCRPDDPASFVGYNPEYNKVSLNNYADEIDYTDDIFMTFEDAFSRAKKCARLEQDYDFFIVSLDDDLKIIEVIAKLSCRINGYHWISLYDSTTKTWSEDKKVR